MITNERQYLITQAQAAKFRDALAAALNLRVNEVFTLERE